MSKPRVPARRQQRDGAVDTNSIVVDKANKHPLRYVDAELALMTANWADTVILHVPGFLYWEIGEERKMDRPDNLCGAQQRAFDFYWQIRCCVQKGLVGLGIGTATLSGPGVLGSDKFCGESPMPERYPEPQGYPHMRLDADAIPYPFFDKQFGSVHANHVIEHLQDPEASLREWLRVVLDGGMVCIVTPDMSYSNRGSVDPTHTFEYSADQFHGLLDGEWRARCPYPFEIVEFNTFDNAFSFNAVLRKI